jgi:aryl-alcohol dehydrogenase-like predicted oxidoreductase
MNRRLEDRVMSKSMRNDVSRRGFLKSAGAGAAATAALSGATLPGQEEQALPQRVLGKTGVRVPVLGLGTAPAGHRPRKEASKFYDDAISQGVTYLDTAPEFTGYGVAQVALGDVLKERRDEVFLVTKCYEPKGEDALALLKQNLKELQTDRADLVYAHSLGADKMDPDTVLGPNGVLKALEKARRDGLCRFIGVTGHNRPERFLRVLEEYDIDVMMNAVNYVVRHIYNFEERVWATARQKNIGLVAMKVLGGMYPMQSAPPDARAKGGRIRGEDMQPAFRYAMGLPGVTTVVLGCFDEAELGQAIGWAKTFQPLSPQEEKALLAQGKQLAENWGEVFGPVV